MRIRYLLIWSTGLAVLGVIGLVAYSQGGVSIDKPMPAHTANIDIISYFDGNNLLMFVTNVGSFAYDDGGWLGRNDGLYFPKSSENTVLYGAGLWVGANVNDAVRLAVAEYSQDFTPGPMVNGTSRHDDDSCRVYKINEGDTRLTNPDYAEWPFDWGAPAAKDYLGHDSLGENGDRVPLLKGKQALWTVFNDADAANHNSGATLPLGIEVRLYVYGDDLSCQSGNTLFMEYTIINEGANTLTDTYVALWADPDIGDPGDDLVGCEPTRHAGFAYNDGSDEILRPYAPAVAMRLLSGPTAPSAGDAGWHAGLDRWVSDVRNLPMTAFLKYINGTDPDSPEEIYNYMRGLERDGSPIIDPTTGLPTKFMVNGDPLLQTGWVDTELTDKRFMLCTGPFTMNPGDTQAVAVAVVAGLGTESLALWGTDTVYAAHTAGASDGQTFAVIMDPTQTTGHDYRVTFELAPDESRYDWTLRDLTNAIDVISDWPNQTGNDDYPIVDGMAVKVIGPGGGVGDWSVPSGTRNITWAGGADGLHFEGFYGAIGWASPASVFGDGQPGVPITRVRNVLLKFADVDTSGQFDPSDPNVSYAYRFGRAFASPPVHPEFAPFIINAGTGYSYQQFARSVPLSAWDVESDPPRRLVVGHLENNREGGMVDGKWWPPSYLTASNVDASGPREWLWIYDVDYSEAVDPALCVEAIGNPLPIMYFLTVARRGEVPFETGDEFLIIRSRINTNEDVFEFTAPSPALRIDFPGEGSCHPGDSIPSLVELWEACTMAHTRFIADACECAFTADGNSDGWVNAVDLAMVIDAMYFGGPKLHDARCPRMRYDLDCDGDMDAVDFQFMIDHVFFGGGTPCEPCNGLTIPI